MFRTESAVQRAIKEARIKAGISKPATVHTLRHSCVTELVRRGVHLRKVQFMMRHKSLDMTLRYAHLSSGHVLKSLERLDKVWRS